MTTIDLLDNALKSLCYVVPPVAGTVIFLKNWQQNETDRVRIRGEKEVEIAKEKSVGATAIASIVQKQEKIREELEEFEKKMDDAKKESKTEFQNIRQEIQQFTMKAIELMTGNIKR